MEKSPLDLYTLEEACKLFFSNIPITVKDLRKEARRGRLAITRINRQQCVSEQAIREMLATCQEKQKPLVSGSSVETTAPTLGASLTAAVKSERESLRTILQEQKARLKSTSQKKRRGKAQIIRPNFLSSQS